MLSSKDLYIINQVAEYYRSPECGRRLLVAAKKFGYSSGKTRKILVTTGDYETEQTKIIKDMKSRGKTIDEIASTLGVSRATVSSSLPYDKLFYGTTDPSRHAAAVREYRAYEKKQKILSASKQNDRREHRVDDFFEVDICRKNSRLSAPKPSKEKGYSVLPNGLIRLNVRLERPFREEDVAALRKYAGVERGNTISRDIIVYENMPLWALHYVLQRAFGFRDCHLHNFEILRSQMANLTENSMKNLLNLSGVIFTDRPFNEMHENKYEKLDPHYEGGSFKRWLREQYTCSWYNTGEGINDFHAPAGKEAYWPLVTHVSPDEKVCKLTRVIPLECENDSAEMFALRNVFIIPEKNINDLGDGISYVKLKNTDYSYINSFVKCDPEDPDAFFVERLVLGDLDIYSGLKYSNEAPRNIIERLPINKVLALSGDYLPYDDEWNNVHTVTGLKYPQLVSDEEIQLALEKQREIMPKPFTDILVYRYDWGDNWNFYITGSKGCSDLVEQGVISRTEFENLVSYAEETARPVLLARDGDMLIEDVGNIEGFIHFLKFLNISDEAIVEERDCESIDWIQYVVCNEKGEENTEKSLINGYNRTELLNWAVSQGWHRNDVANVSFF